MYLRVLFIALVPILAKQAYQYDMADSDGLFLRFMEQYGKQYNDLKERINRKYVFQNNLILINTLNKAQHDAEFRINKFADLTPQEFKEKVLMPSREIEERKEQKREERSGGPKEQAWDWREKGAVSSVKNQGQFGSCWAFSTVGNVEGQHFLKTGEMVDLSVEQILECDATVDPNNKNADCGIFGGWPYLALQYVHSAGGLSTDQDYPYCISFKDDDKNKCWPCSAEGYDKDRCGEGLFPPRCKVLNPCRKDVAKKAQISGWKRLSSEEDTLADQLVEYGPVSVGLDAGWLQFYHWGIFNPFFGCSKTALDHAVLMVGYGTQDSKDYWIIKNSWGPDWGDKGYFKILRGQNTCGIATDPVTATQ